MSLSETLPKKSLGIITTYKLFFLALSRNIYLKPNLAYRNTHKCDHNFQIQVRLINRLRSFLGLRGQQMISVPTGQHKFEIQSTFCSLLFHINMTKNGTAKFKICPLLKCIIMSLQFCSRWKWRPYGVMRKRIS